MTPPYRSDEMWLMPGMIAVKAALLARDPDRGGVSLQWPGKAIRATRSLAVGMQGQVGGLALPQVKRHEKARAQAVRGRC